MNTFASVGTQSERVLDMFVAREGRRRKEVMEMLPRSDPASLIGVYVRAASNVKWLLGHLQCPPVR